jgi:hypothetical protein
MKKITLKLILSIVMLLPLMSNAQCLTSTNGLYPSATYTIATCDGLTANVVTTLGYASEYSNVNVTSGETYTFGSSIQTDYVTISNDDGVSATIFGATPVTWVADVTGVVRFYTHADDLCTGNTTFRVRSVICGIPPCIQPHVAFSRTYDCLSNSFEVIADITDIGSANTITVTDDQGSSPQTVGSAGPVTFGPYAFGTSVIITATNDDTPICNVVSATQLVAACPPDNDECSGALALTINSDGSCTIFTSGTILAATASSVDETSCFGTEDDDVWYSFVAENSSHTISLNNVAGTTTDLFHSLWTGDCSSLTLVPGTCSDNNYSTPIGLIVGETYYLRVFTYTATPDQTSTFDVCIGTPPPPPANDECDGAIALSINPGATCDIFTSATIQSATPSAVDATSCFGSEDDDVWFSFVAENTAHTINLNNVAGSTTDLFHSLWTGDCASLTLVPGTCTDPDYSTPTGLIVGQTYYLRVNTYTTTTGQTTTFDVCIGTPPPPPANDECDGAIALDVNPDASCAIFTSTTIQSATPSAVDAAGCGGTEDDDVWFSFVATDIFQAISLINVAGSTTDLYHSLWTGDCASLTLVPGSCSDNNASTPTGLVAGETYYLRVYTSTATTGQTSTFDVCVGTPPPPPANDDCSGAIELTAGGTISSFPETGSTVSATNSVGLPVLTCVPTNRSNDVWYTVTVPDSGTLTVETDTAPGTLMTDTVLSVFSGTCGALTEVGCDDDAGNANFSKIVLTGLTPGEVLYVGVWKYGNFGSDGEFQLSAYDASLLSNTSFENENFRAYPNPVKDVLNLSYNKTISNVSVFNILGQEVMIKSINANQSQIDMSGLTAGTYLVKVTADNQVKTIKVIKE